MLQQHNCPVCGSTNLIKDGATIELLLAERISLLAICRVMEIQAHQLYTYMDERYDEVLQDLACSVRDICH